MVDSVTLGQVFLRALQFSPIIVIPPTLHTHLHLHMILGRRTNGLRLEIFQKPNAFFQIFYVLLTVHPNTGLFEMIVWVLATCHTQYTWDRSICIFFYLIEQHSTFLFTYLIGALYVHHLWFCTLEVGEYVVFYLIEQHSTFLFTYLIGALYVHPLWFCTLEVGEYVVFYLIEQHSQVFVYIPYSCSICAPF